MRTLDKAGQSKTGWCTWQKQKWQQKNLQQKWFISVYDCNSTTYTTGNEIRQIGVHGSNGSSLLVSHSINDSNSIGIISNSNCQYI